MSSSAKSSRIVESDLVLTRLVRLFCLMGALGHIFSVLSSGKSSRATLLLKIAELLIRWRLVLGASGHTGSVVFLLVAVAVLDFTSVLSGKAVRIRKTMTVDDGEDDTIDEMVLDRAGHRCS